MDYIITQINDALNEAIGVVARIMKNGREMHEPDYTAAITLCFPIGLQTILGPKVKVGGCFVHQNPILHFENQKNGCELGDLLVVCRKQVDGEQRHNAALFQLKMSKKQVETPDNTIQLKLYTEWPAFSIGSKYDNNNFYNIEPKTVTLGAQYMFVINPYLHSFYHETKLCNSIPEKNMPVDTDFSFGKFIWDFIHWQNGRPFAIEDFAAEDEWSRLMWDVISRTNDVLFHRRSISDNGIPRQNGDFFQLFTQKYNSFQRGAYLDFLQKVNEGTAPNNEDPIIFDENEHGAISILFVDIEA